MVKDDFSGLVPAGSRFSWALVWAYLLVAGCAITAPGHADGVAGGGASAGEGSSALGGTRAAGGAGAELGCEPGTRRCSADTPQACKPDGTWADEQACAVGEACSGAGVCAAFRLVGAGIGTFGEHPAEPGAGAALILKEQTLSAAPRACTDKLCITGDLR